MPGETRFPVPDWSKVHRELRRKGVTLALLWQEDKEAHPQGMQYRGFCRLYRAWTAKLDVVMRQAHRAGEKRFVDDAEPTVAVVERDTGELREAQVFVAGLGASSYTYAEATWTQTLPEWIASHVRAFRFYGGCSELLIPDNLRSAVSRVHRYEPDTNPTYHALACPYGIAVRPTRVKKPRDKAKAEGGVQVVERVGPGRATPPHLLLCGRAQRRDREAPRAAQRTPAPQAPGLAALAVRAPGASPPSRPALRVRPVEEGAGQHRLPRRGGAPLLLRPPRPGRTPARRAVHLPHRGVHLPRPARRQPRTLPAQRPPSHRR